MPLSISNSEREPVPALPRSCLPAAGTAAENRRIKRATRGLLALVLGVLCSAELSARFLFPHISHIEGRIAQDRREVMAIRAPTVGDPRTVLLVGNSLLLLGLDYPKLRAALAPDQRAVRYVVENTEYLDWYYGLRRLFAAGIRPATVVLCLNPQQTLDRGFLGDYSAHALFQASDLFAVSREAGLDHTQLSELVFAHWSAFYADRATIRNYILNRSDPGYAAVLHRLADQNSPALPPSSEAIAQSRLRLRAIKQLCLENGSDFVLLIPPALLGQPDLLAEAGALEGVDVDVPVPVGALSSDFFLDGFHLNDKGADIFTTALAKDLRARAATQTSSFHR